MSDLPAGPGSVPVDSLALVILDGWGLAEPGPGNAVELASTPTFDEIWERYPRTTLSASGRDVGLPPGQMGNSEVGHLNLGAGAVVKQDLARIDDAIADGTFFENEVLVGACERARSGPRGRLHLIGLVSDGGVHSGWEHIEACIELAANEGVPDLVLHVLTDGRDTSPTGGARYVEEVERWLRSAGRVGTVSGRYFAMDRDRRWDRVQQAYDLLAHAKAPHAASTGVDAVEAAYERGETDEFVTATTVGEDTAIRSGDAVIAFNFRPDRMREITQALADPDFGEVDRGDAPIVTDYTCLTGYDAEWDYPVAFPPARPEVTLPKVIAANGGKQLHVAETEKYPHVTYFFGGGKEQPETGERREMAPSPRDVATYDEKPQMSAEEAADKFVAAWGEEEFRFAVINFANPDMVGHTGVIPAAVTAIETVDACLGRIAEAVQGTGGALIVTADHGNADNMLEPDGSPNTAHSLNPVPFIVTVDGVTLDPDGGILADVAPTALALLGIEQPPEMTGRSLIGDRSAIP